MALVCSKHTWHSLTVPEYVSFRRTLSLMQCLQELFCLIINELEWNMCKTAEYIFILISSLNYYIKYRNVALV